MYQMKRWQPEKQNGKPSRAKSYNRLFKQDTRQLVTSAEIWVLYLKTPDNIIREGKCEDAVNMVRK